MDKMREEFEAWYSNFDGYGEAHKKELWDTWKASRAALCVELPSRRRSSYSDHYACGFDNALYAVEIKMEMAGVPYK